MRLENQVVIVTGAGQGIGKALAESLAAEKATVVLADLNGNAAEQAKQELIDQGAQAMAVEVDVSDKENVQQMVESVLAKYGRIDGLINNAGISRPAMLYKMEDQDWDRVLKVHLYGAFYCTQAVAKPMMNQQSGRIVNITSSAGIQGTIGQINYASAKAGIIGMTKSAAKELAKYNILVNAIAPAAITSMTEKIYTDPKLKDIYLNRIPLKRFADPKETTPIVVHLISNENTYITGQVINVNGGSVM